MLPIFWLSAVIVTMLCGAARPAMTMPPSGLTRTMSKLGTIAPGEPGAGAVPEEGAVEGLVPADVPALDVAVPVLAVAFPPVVLPVALPVPAAELPVVAVPELPDDGAVALLPLDAVWLPPVLGWVVAVAADCVFSVVVGALVSATSSRLMA